MKISILKKYNRILSILMSLLGFGSSLSFIGCENVSPAEYGTPHATYKVNGRVTNQSNTGIENIQITMYYDTSFTNENGEYNIEVSDFPTIDTLHLKFTDVDGSANGSYQEVDSLISY